MEVTNPAEATSEAKVSTPITVALIKQTIEQVPIDRLSEVYEYLIELLEDAMDIAAIEAARAEMQRTGEEGIPLEEYLRESGLKDEVEAYVKSEGFLHR
jgi:hypothetical protein